MKNSLWDGKQDDEQSLIHHPRTRPESDPEKESLKPQEHSHALSEVREKRKRWLIGRRHGWRFGVAVSACTVSAVLLLNIIFLIVAVAKFGHKRGIGTLFDGSCHRVNEVTTWLHILINVLSSALLSASNYTMQALSAPTRKDIDLAHQKRQWLDIGVTSVRNLFKIHRLRGVLWCMLAVSSLPIHLLYNSAVFKSIDTNMYTSVVANPIWLKVDGNFSLHIPWADQPRGPGLSPLNVSLPNDADLTGNASNLQSVRDFFAKNIEDPNTVANLSTEECMQTYGTDFISGWADVIAITHDNGSFVNETMFFAQFSAGGPNSGTYDWMCYRDFKEAYADSCNIKDLKKNASEWVINGKRVDYCLAHKVPQHCIVQYSLGILVSVIVANAVKCAAMLATLLKRHDPTFVTIGDAIASYLERPDKSTKGRCFMSREDVTNWESGTDQEPSPKMFVGHMKRKWFSAATRMRWATTFGLIAIALAVALYLLSQGVRTLSGSLAFTLGFGSLNASALISTNLPSTGSAGVVASVLLANCPQAIVSLLYLLYNSLMTSLWLAKVRAFFATRYRATNVR